MTARALAPTTSIGIIGCGNIFERYVRGMARFDGLAVTWCADVDVERARRGAEEFAIPNWGSPEELLGDPDVEVVVNITPPTVHAAVTDAAVAAGKHIYVEKPLDTTVAGARAQVARAEDAGVALGCATDTFLGSAGQTARAVIDSGEIGEPVGATLFVTHSRAETWHPDPTFLFTPGGGPALDLGPYYVTTLVNCLGPVSSVFGRQRIGARQRHVTAPDRLVDTIDVQIPTHSAAVLTLASGALATVMMSFDVWDHHLPYVEIYGTRGTLTLPDPNEYDGPVRVRLHADTEWRTVDPVLPAQGEPGTPQQLMRGPGVADLVASLNGAPRRVRPDLALHVLEVLEGIERSAEDGGPVTMTSTCERPATVRTP